MASNEIVFKVKVEKDGNLSVVAKEAEKAAKGTDKLAKSTNKLDKSQKNHNKTAKGVGQSGLSGAKAFSKMRQEIGGGSSGLVGAYAVLAANIFALTAAFGALQRAAQVEQLERGLASMGAASGVAMMSVSEGLVEATGHALSLEEAMRATALATSAGFDSSSIERLGDVARKASIALGRDTTDSLNRLTKGAIKLEPELLDELGIMVRLDDATSAYALAIGKTSNDLTTFEKRQAFMNAVLAEGEKKFGALGAVETNPYDKLSATFANLTKNLLGFLNKGLGPLVNFFADSQVALFGIMVKFGSTIAKSMLPGLASLGQGYDLARHEAAAYSLEQLKVLKTLEGGSKGLKKAAASFDPSIHGQKELNSLARKASMSYKRNQSDLANLTEERERDTAAIVRKTAMLKASQGAVNQIGQANASYASSQREIGDNLAVSEMAAGNYRQGLRQLTTQFAATNAATTTSIAGTSAWTATTIIAGSVASRTALAVRVLGTAFLTMIPHIGMIIMVMGILYEVAMKLIEFFKSDAQKEYEAIVKKQAEANLELAASMEAIAAFEDGRASVITNIVQKVRALTTATASYKRELIELAALEKKGGVTPTDDGSGIYQTKLAALAKAGKGSDGLRSAIINAPDQLPTGGYKKDQGNLNKMAQGIFTGSYEGGIGKMSEMEAKIMLSYLIPAIETSQGAIDLMTRSVEGSAQAFDEFARSVQMKTSVDNIVAGVDDINTAMKEIAGTNATEYLDAFELAITDNMSKVLGIDVKALRDEQVKVNGMLTSGKTDRQIRAMVEKNLKDAKVTFDGRQKVERQSKDIIAGLKAENEQLGRNNLVRGNAQSIIINTNKIIDEQVKLLRQEKSDIDIMAVTTGEKEVALVRNLGIEQKILKLINEKVEVEGESLSIAQENLRIHLFESTAMQQKLALMAQMISMQNTLTQAVEAEMKHNMVISNRLSRDGRGAMNANDELQLNKKKPPGSSLRISAEGAVTMAQEETLLDLKKQAITNEYNLTVLKNKMERTTMKLRMELLDQELVARNKANGGDGNYAGRENLKQTIKMLADDGPFDTMQKNVAKAIRDGAKNGLDATDADLKERREGELMGSDGSLTGSIIGDMQEKGGIDSLDKTSKKIKAMGLAMAPMIENLKKLGPEGELVAAMAQGAFTMGEAWANAGEKMQSSVGGTLGKAQKAEAVLGAIGATLSTISNILNAASDMRIAQIDKEIAAEKKRDGQTKGSLNKIAALEAKKEAEKKKAFETNKKMQMAMVVVNTAMAISAAVAAGAQAAIATGGTTLPAWVGAFVAIVSVLGAAQLALIAGTSYQGGGGGIASASTPSSVSVGERRNTVDTSKSEGGAGELAYMRGDQGTGGPENFRGAFYGKKHRAAGGDTGYIVGEQGPELFMPDRPGTIVTADDTAAMGGGSNVTFNISTVDAAGVEDLLAEQQGNIIGMLRQAANSYGEEFMEDIDTTAVSGSSARRA